MMESFSRETLKSVLDAISSEENELTLFVTEADFKREGVILEVLQKHMGHINIVITNPITEKSNNQ